MLEELGTAKFNWEKVLLQALDLPLGPSIVISSDTLLELLRLDIAKKLKMDLFAISLLGTTIQDGGIGERSDQTCNVMLILNPKSKNKKINGK